MNLSKIELQEMLREMGLKFSASASYDELRRMFQDENHRRWLGQNRPEGPKRVIRRRRKPPAEASDDPSPSDAEVDTASHAPPPRETERRPGATKARPRRELPPRRFQRRDGGPVADRQQNVFATVLRRAKGRCELCDSATLEADAKTETPPKSGLNPFYLVPLNEGGQEVIKNVVALCQACQRKLTAQPAASDLKALKRKARQKVISSVVVIRR